MRSRKQGNVMSCTHVCADALSTIMCAARAALQRCLNSSWRASTHKLQLRGSMLTAKLTSRTVQGSQVSTRAQAWQCPGSNQSVSC